MPRNNKGTIIFGSSTDKARKAKDRIAAAKRVQQNRYEATKEDLKKTIELMYSQKEYIKESNHIVVNKNPWKKKQSKGDINPITEKLLGQKNFFEVVAGKIQDSKEFLGITLENLNTVTMSNQIGGGNESLASWQQSVDFFNSNVKDKGSVIAWDLETTGGRDLNGIWRPDSITEFSMQEYNYITKETTKTNILVGMSKEEGNHVLEEIEQAIKNGTIDTNERLRVSAMRYAKYGDESFSMEKLADKGYYVATNFPKDDKNNWKDIDAIKRGIDRLVEVGTHTDIDENNIRLDKKAIAQAINNANRSLASGNTTLVGYNDLKHDKSILESVLLKWSNENANFKSLFDNESVGFNVNSENWLDLFGGVKLYSDYNPISDLYHGANIADIDKIRGQEFLAQKHLPSLFKGPNALRPHMAEDDVTALLSLVTNPSELLNNNESFLDYITNGLNKVQTNNINVGAGSHVLRAKKGVGRAQDGKNYFNFAHSKSTNEIFTFDNHVIKDGKIHKEGFSAGFGITKGHMYDVLGISKFTLDDELRTKLGEISPAHSGKEMYRVQLGMTVHDSNQDMRMNDLVQNLVFKNEKEMNAFLSEHFDVVAERLEDGDIKIVEGMERYFDRRQLVNKNGKASFEVLNKAASDKELFNAQVLANNEKLAVSRADNAMFKDNSYKKVTKALNLKARLQKELGIEDITGKDILTIMSDRVSKGQMAMELSNEQIMNARNIISQTLGFEKDNIHRLLRSTVDNNAIGIDMLSTHERMLTNVINSLNGLDNFSKQSNGYKQELFSRVLKEVKTVAAQQLYDNSNIQDMLILGDKRLESTFAELKNIYEINYSKLIKGNKVQYIDTSNPDKYANILKLDLSNGNSPYSLIDKAVEIIHGKNNLKDNAYEIDAIGKMFAMLDNDDDLSKTETFKRIKSRLNYKNNEFQKDYNAYEVSEAIIGAMKEVKSHNATKGFINIDHAFMKALEGNVEFGNLLNSDNIVNQIPDIVKRISKDFKYTELADDKDIRRLAEQLVSKHYMPSFEAVKNSVNYNDTMGILYKNAKKDMTDYMSKVLKSITKIDDASLSIQENGELLINRAGRIVTLGNLPRVGLDETSGVMDIRLGSMKIQLGNELIFDEVGRTIKGTTRSTLGILNEYDFSRNIKYVTENEGGDAALDALIYSVNRAAKSIRQKPTINGYGGNDMDSNNSVALSGIKKVLPQLFRENGSLNYMVENEKFADKELLETLKESLKYYVDDKEMDSIGPETTRDLGKNMETLLDIIRRKGNVDDDFFALSQDLSFTGSEKRVSDLVAVKGYRPSNSTFGVFDNTQRPPITQSGNAYQLRVDDILNATKTKNMNLGVGNVISNNNMNNRLLRSYSGIGNTTTDVMMDITYIDTNSLNVLFDTNFARVISENSVDFNTKEQAVKAYVSVQKAINTFEQERAIDSRVHEATYGLRSAQTQKLSKNFDVVNIIDSLKDADFEAQAKALIDQRGSFSMVDGELTYNAAYGKILRRGESAIKWQGFAELESNFASKMQTGLFNYNYYEADGTKLRTSEINKIIKQNKNLFANTQTDAERFDILNQILSSKNIRGQFAIEDISALGYAKTMTSGAEKGMTKVVYASTGSYDSRVQQFFKGINAWNDVKEKVLTDEAIDAFYYRNEKTGIQALKNAGFKNLQALKQAMEIERHTHSEMLFDKILKGTSHVLANDAVVKHGNVGQMYQGTLSKAINSLTKKYGGDQNAAVDYIVNLINSDKKYQFINNIDLREGFKEKNFKSLGIINDNGVFKINENFKTGSNIVTSLNSKRFGNLIKEIDKQLDGLNQEDRLILKDVYVMDSDGNYKKHNEMFGSFKTVNKTIKAYDEESKTFKLVQDAKVILSTNTRENVKYVKDAETQTGVNAEYFELKKTSRALKKEKIELEKQIQSTTNNSPEQNKLKLKLLDIKNKINDIDEDIAAYSGAVKTMKFGDQELSILERISVTEAHANKINELIESGEVNSSTFLDSVAFRGKVEIVDGKLKFSDDIIGKRALAGLTDQLRGIQYFDRFSEDILTADMVATNKKHLKEIYEYATKHGLTLGVDSAEQQYQNKLADKANKFNKGNLGKTKEELISAKNGFEERNILDLKFGLDDIATKNLMVDLGEDFNLEDRYIAIPGLGMKVADTEVRTEAQTKLLALQHRMQELKGLAGEEGDKKEAIISKVITARQEAIDAISKNLYGKNGVMHSSAKIEIDAVSYRLKASGVISNNFTDDIIEAAKNIGVDLSNSAMYTDKAMINGKTISEWEKSGEAFFKYKFVSREQMENIGYFTDETLQQYGFLEKNFKKADRVEAINKMEDFLKTHGTFDITDRYPNTRNESLASTRVFLGEGLAGNQTKVSVALMLGANGDNDGDSYSSFRVELRDKNGKSYDGGLYELAKTKAQAAGETDVRAFAIKNNIMDGDVFDQFASIEQAMISDAVTGNKHWNKEGLDKIMKDYIKNQNVSNPDNMVLVPGGKSILGKNAFANITGLPTMEEFYANEKEANNILAMAKQIAKDKSLDGADDLVDDIRMGNSSKVLDEALSIIEKYGNLDEDALAQIQASAIKRANIDRYSQEIMAKTGLAATGSVNLSLNSVKLAEYFSTVDPNKSAYTNYIWSVLDTAEQGVISSKKLEGTVYDDKRIAEFKQAMKNIFNGKGKASDSAITGLTDWLDTYGDKVFETAYKEMGDKILTKEQLTALNGINDAKERAVKGASLMKSAFSEHIQSMSGDNILMSYVDSFNLMGRNGKGIGDAWGDGRIGIAAAEGHSMSAIQQGMMGYSNEEFLDSEYKKAAQRALGKEQSEAAKNKLNVDSATKRAFEQAVEGYTEQAGKAVSSMSNGKGLAMTMLGLAAGLMVGGYAAGNPLNDKSAEQVSQEQAPPQETMSIPDFMEKQGGYVTGNSQQGYIINIRADSKKGRKHLEKMMAKAAEATVGGAVSINMNIRNLNSQGVTDKDIEDYINRHF